MSIQIAKAFKPLRSPKRYKIFFGGRGASKSWAFAQTLLAMGAEKPIRVLCTREFQVSIRESVHKLLSDTVERMGLSSWYDVQQQTIIGRNGTNFVFAGLRNNVTQIKSMEGLDIVWCEEAEAISDYSWETLIPTVRESGSQIWVSFNPHLEEDPTYQRFVIPYLDEIEARGRHEDRDMYVSKVSWRDNPWFPDELRREMEIMKASDDAKYRHVWEGECMSGIDGAIYQDQLRDAAERITNVPIETNIPVNTFWDLGRNDTTAIWFHQRAGLENRFIDYYESRLVGLDHYAKMLKEKGYLYGDHYLPHDVVVTELTTNMSRQEKLESLGVSPISIVPRVRDINEGIEQARSAFPSCWFDKKRCADGLKALRNYQYLYDDKYHVFRAKPAHTWASNGADAFRQFAQGYAPETAYEQPQNEHMYATSGGWMA